MRIKKARGKLRAFFVSCLYSDLVNGGINIAPEGTAGAGIIGGNAPTYAFTLRVAITVLSHIFVHLIC